MSQKLLEKKERERAYALHQKRIAEARKGRPNRTPLSVNPLAGAHGASSSSSTSRKSDPRSPRTSARLAAAARVAAARSAAAAASRRPHSASGSGGGRGGAGGAVRPRTAAELGEAERAYDQGLGISERGGLSKEERDAQARRRADARRLYARRLRSKVRAKVLELSVVDDGEEEMDEDEARREEAEAEAEEEADVQMDDVNEEAAAEEEASEEEDDDEEEEVVVASLASSVKELTSLLGASNVADSEREELEGLAARLLQMEKEAKEADEDLEASLKAADAAMNRLSSYNFKSPSTVSKAARVAHAAPRGRRYAFKPPQ